MIPQELRSTVAAFRRAVRKLPDNPTTQLFCTVESVRAYQLLETVFWEESGDPIPLIREEFERLARTLRGLPGQYDQAGYAQRVVQESGSGSKSAAAARDDVKTVTGELYSSLFTRFSERHYLDEAKELLRQRIERNGIGYDWLRGKKGLDAGCGGGRYTVALRQLGAARVTGIDYGRDNVKDARRRIARASISAVNFRHADVLEIPYKDSSFDFAFSNGVLHHTTDPFRGIQELYRVVKPGGYLWIFLYGAGLWWELMHALRPLSMRSTRQLTQHVMQLMGYAPNRIFKFMDSLFVPIIESYTARQMERMLKRAGFADLTNLPRCVDMPHFRGVNELLGEGGAHAAQRWGAGELRYLARKRDKG